MTHQQHRPQRQFSRLLTIGVAAALIAGSAFSANVAFAGSQKGAEKLMIVGVGTDASRCGPPVQNNVVLNFAGEGLDTVLGFFTSVASACQNTETGLVSDLRAEDTNLNGDTIIVTAEDFFLIPDPETCIASIPDGSAQYTVTGDTGGAFEDWSGEGKFEIYAYVTGLPCTDESVPPHAYVTFSGIIEPPG